MKLADLSPDDRAHFDQVYEDLVTLDTDRTNADSLERMEELGIMASKILTSDDDLFGLDSLEVGDRCWNFTEKGAALIRERNGGR